MKNTILTISILYLISSLIPLYALTQTPDFLDSLHETRGKRGIAITGESGAVFIQSTSVDNVKASHPKAFGLEWSTLRTDRFSYSLFRSYVRRGYNLSYEGFDNKILGHGLRISVFLEPIYRISNRLQFLYRGDIGVSYLSRPFDSTLNPTNMNYCMRFTPYIRLGTGFGYRLSNHLTFSFMGNMLHFSNGNFRQPNAGLNIINISASLIYYPQGNLLPHYHLEKVRNWIAKKPTIDIGWMFVPRQDYISKSNVQRHYMMGFFGQIAKQFSNIDALTLGLEAYYNNFSNGPGALPDNDRPSLLSGLHLGHEFLMGKMIFSQQIGAYLTARPAFYPTLYHRWGLRYLIGRHLAAGFNFKAHGKTADFIDLRLQFHF